MLGNFIPVARKPKHHRVTAKLAELQHPHSGLVYILQHISGVHVYFIWQENYIILYAS